jgi:hypothetical protein
MPVIQAIKAYLSRLRSLPSSLWIRISAIGSLLLIPLICAVYLKTSHVKPVLEKLPTSPTVGTEAFETLILDQPSYKVAEVTPNTPLLVRITGVEATGDGAFQYSLSFRGLETGVFNLTDFLANPVGERLREPVATVTIESAIPAHSVYAAVWPSPPFQGRAFPYRLTLWMGTFVWAACGALLFWPKKQMQPTAPPASPEPAKTEDRQPIIFNRQTLADLLRPLVEKAANKSITAEEKAELEGILFQYWGKDLELDHLNSVEQLRRILEHPEAGALLRTVEQWLYQPDSHITEEEINEALESYLGIPSAPQQPTKMVSEEPSHSNVSTILPT